MLLPSINYVIFPTVQTVTSPDLRKHVFGKLSSCCDQKEKKEPAPAAVALVEQIEIEMKAMPLEPRPPIV